MDDSLWIKTTPDAGCPSLARSQKTDVAIIGGGLTGLHAALKILEDDPATKVVLVEADRICCDASGRTMGKVTSSHSGVFTRLPAGRGAAYVQANQEGFARILELVEAYAIDCDLQRVSNYIFAADDSKVDRVRKDFESMRAGGLDVEWVEPRDSASSEVPSEFVVGIRHSGQAVYHPRKFALGLLGAIRSLGGDVYEHTVATGLVEQDEGVAISIDGGLALEAKKAIVATRVGLDFDEPFSDSLSFWHEHILAYLLEDMPLKNSYIRYKLPVTSFRANTKHLLLGGKDAEALPFEDEKHYQAIETWAQQAFEPGRLQDRRTAAWWGEDGDSADMLPLIGPYRKDSKHTFMAAGYCGWGMAKAAFAGIMLSDLVAGRASPYQESFDPWRFGSA